MNSLGYIIGTLLARRRAAKAAAAQHAGGDAAESRAYVVWSEWGPEAGVPRAERLAAEFPQVPDAVRRAWLGDFERVNGVVWGAAQNGGERSLTRDAFAAWVRGQAPFMNDEAVDRAWFLANYYAYKEGTL